MRVIKMVFNQRYFLPHFPVNFLLFLFICWGALNCKGDHSTDTETTTGKEIRDDASTIDAAVDEQVISGFGAANILPWRPDLTSEEVDKAFGTGSDQLGLSILRLRIPPSEDRFSLNLPTAKLAHSMGVKVIASPWSPPAGMKTNNDLVGGSLKQENYEEYAYHLADFATYMEDNGAPLYALSIQNEPDIEVDYESCDWTFGQLNDFIYDFGSIIQQQIRIIVPESYNFNHSVSDPLLETEGTAEHIDIIGGHIYGGGLKPYPLARQKGKEVWMTEHLDTETDYASVLATGKEIHDCLTAGNFNAYIWWYIKRFYGPLGEDGEITKRGYVMGNFAKFIRPGYQRKEATATPQPNIFVSAYEGDDKLIIVALNMGSSAVEQQFVLNNSDHAVTSFVPYVTSSTANLSEKGSVTVSADTSNFIYALPAKSIVTFVES